MLNLRNGFGLANVGGNTQTGVIGAILIGSVLAQNLIESSAAGAGGRIAAGMRAEPPTGGAVAIAGGAASLAAHISTNNTGGKRP